MKNLVFVSIFFAVVVSIFLGIWWEAFPFWKVIGTIVVLTILFNIFKKK